MLPKLTFRRLLLLFFILAVLSRLTFVLGQKQTPVMWDARIYSSAALGLLHYMHHGGAFGHPERYSAADSLLYQNEFLSTMDKYIKGEKIEWLYYAKPTVGQAEEYLFISGPLYPAYLAAVFLVGFGSDFATVRILNSVIDGICLVLLMMIAFELFGRRTSILGGILYLVYFPFFILCGMVSPEPITVLLILNTFLFLLQWHKTGGKKYIYLAGVALGLLVLAKPTATLLFVPFAAGYFYDCRRNLKEAASNLGRAAIPFALIVAPWLLITSLYFGQISIRDPRYSEANFRSSSSIKFEGYDLDVVEKDFWISPVAQKIVSDPLGYGGLLVKKFFRLWAQPYNDFKSTFLWSDKSGGYFHLLIVITGMFGVFLYIVNHQKGLIYLLLLPAYYSLVHMILHSLARYNVNAMPVMIVAAAAVLSKIAEYVTIVWRQPGRVAHLIRWTLLLAGGAFVIFFPVSGGVRIIGSSNGVWVSICLKLAVVFGMLFIFSKLISRQLGFNKAIKFQTVPAVVALLVLSVCSAAPDSWAEWRCRLDRPSREASVKIFFPRDFHLKEGDAVNIMLDIGSPRNAGHDLSIALNGVKSPFIFGRSPLNSNYYRKASYRVFEEVGGYAREEMRYWSLVPLSAAAVNQLVARDGFLNIELSAREASGESNGAVIDLYGDYSSLAGDMAFVPAMEISSIERLVDKGDPRVWLKYPLSSDSVISYYVDNAVNAQSTTRDISPAGGRQSGRYRIFVRVQEANERRSYY
jgi:4-amino-4-deoxy-L-arabinose transferase-like glycosyltransferase